jgi:hypothetical protein|tara:strand:- start:890 stop:1072 length:183 start_codon:yes stop_codon:yes gene_type:complete
MTKQQAISHFKSVAALARVLGISTQAVYDWGDQVPELRQLQLEKITDGALTAEPKQVKAA